MTDERELPLPGATESSGHGDSNPARLDEAGDARPEASPPAADPGRSRAALLLLSASLVLIAFNLRCAVASVGPVLPEIIRATGLSPAEASALTTLPSLCFGLFGPLGPALSRRIGTEHSLLAVLVAMALGTALRGLGGAPALFAGQILSCGGIGVINVLLPGLVKRDFPQHAAIMTGLYVMALCVGAAAAAGSTVPLEHRFGGSWPAALAFWAAPAALAVLLWVTQLPRAAQTRAERGWSVRGLWSDPLAWQVTLFMGLQSAFAYIVFGWLAPILRDRGLDPVQAGLVVSVSVLGQAAGSLFAPWLATIGRDQRLASALSSLVCVGSFLACIFGPLSWVWVWSIVLGLSEGALFAIALMLIVLRASDARVAAHLSSMAQSVGYVLASAGPLLAGLLHGWTGSWNALIGLSFVLGAVMLASGIGASRTRHVGAVSVQA